jgi:hydroxymethylpyrimidine/phosphomethylpyrimidine kinase
MTAITAITAQNTIEVTAVQSVPEEMILAQVSAVVRDIGVDGVKIGMLGTVPTIEAVRSALELLPPGVPVVLDPVMVAESGAQLLEPDARDALVRLMLPIATVATPNVPEARVLAQGRGDEVAEGDGDDVAALARAIKARGPGAVVVTGGHREEATDVFFDGEELVELGGERVADGAAHGSGCTHSAALAAFLAWGYEPLEAARSAQEIATAAIRNGLHELGAGAGPVDALGLRARRPPLPR